MSVLGVDDVNRLGFRPIGQSVPDTWMEWIAGDEQEMVLQDGE